MGLRITPQDRMAVHNSNLFYLQATSAESNDWGKIACLKPMEYMNKSWWPVSKLANFYKIEPKDILIIHDEIDLPVWTVKLKFWWGLAGHNWLKDIALKLWTQDFWRIRIGVDRPASSNMVADYVLSTFKPDEKVLLQNLETQIFQLINDFLWK